MENISKTQGSDKFNDVVAYNFNGYYKGVKQEIKALEEQKKETERKERLEIKKRWEEVMG